MNELVLTKSSSESDLKRYFTAVLKLSQSDNQFPINLDEVWMLVYAQKDKAVRALKKHFFENEDFVTVTQNGEGGKFASIDYHLSLSCMEYFIARKVRPVFEVYRQVFHKTVNQKPMMVLPKDYKQALTQLLAQVEANEQLQLENQKLTDKYDKQKVALGLQKDIIKSLEDDNSVKQNIINFQSGELDTLMPKGRVYDQVIQTPQDACLFTTRQVAQEIGLSDHRLYAILMQIGVLYKQSNTYMLHSEYIGWGLHKMVSHTINADKGIVTTYLKWSLRGRAYIHALHDTDWDKRRAYNLLKKGHQLQTT